MTGNELLLTVCTALTFTACATDTPAPDTSQRAQAALREVADRMPASTQPLEQQAAGFVLARDGVLVELPASAAKAIRLDVLSGTRTVQLLGSSVTTTNVEAIDDHTLLYAGTDVATSTAVSVVASDDETLLESFTILDSEAAPESHRIRLSLLPGEHIVSADATTLHIVDASEEVVGVVEAPWAVDAAGRDVPYALAATGDQIEMTVHHRGGNFTYPIVADPAIRLHCGIVTCSVYFSRSVTRRMVTPAGAAWAVSAFCGALPSPASLACYALGASAGLLATKSAECSSKNQCLRIRFTRTTPPVPVGMYCDGGRYCSN